MTGGVASDTLCVLHGDYSLAYQVRGEGAPVLMIQGEGWRPQVDGLADRYRCLTFDNRGMAGSQPVGASVTVEQLTADALALMDARGWEFAHVVGHSLGGLIAQQLALTARARVRTLSLLCSFSRG